MPRHRRNFDDAMDSYDKVLEIVGELSGEVIAQNAADVDIEGPHCENGRVQYAAGTADNIKKMRMAGMNGMTMPRQYNGLNFAMVPYTMCAENRRCCRCRFQQHLVAAGLYRDLVRVW